MVHRLILAFILWTACAMAGQSLVLTGGATRSITGANVGAGDLRLEMRIVGFSTTSGTVPFAWLNLFNTNITVYANARLEVQMRGALCQYPQSVLSSDMLLRSQADIAGSRLICEKVNADGTGYWSAVVPVASWAAVSGNGGSINAMASGAAQLAFIRGFTTLVPLKSRPPVTADVGNHFDWKLDGNGNATAGTTPTINVTGASFVDTPDLPPVAMPRTPDTPAWAEYLPLRAGHTNDLTGLASYSLADNDASVDCWWTQVDHDTGLRTSEVVWTGRNTCGPTVRGLVFGPYRFRLAVTDGAGVTTQADLAAGAVAYDAQGVVAYPDPRMHLVLGPQMVLGRNPWQWVDSQWSKMEALQRANYQIFGGTWNPEWLQATVLGVPRTGTAYTLSGAPTKLYGVGTNFLIYCGGSPGAVVGTRWVAIEGLPGQWYARPVGSCQSDTELQLATQYTWEQFTNLGSPGVRWGTYGFDPDRGEWAGQRASNINYYDVGAAHLKYYLATGDYRALQAHRWLSGHWARNLFMTAGFAPRDRSLLGVVALQTWGGGIPGLTSEQAWAAIRRARNTSAAAASSAVLDDPRESAYALAGWAETAILDPDPAERAAARAVLVSGYADRWAAQQQPAGNYIDSGEYGDRDNTRVMVMTQGSRTVTKHSGSDFSTNYCGVSVASPGSIAIAGDGVTVTGTGTSFSGQVGRRVFLSGTLGGQPWAMVSTVSSVASDTSMVLGYPWRGDVASVTDYQIVSGPPSNGEGAGSYYTTFFWRVNSAGVEASPRVIDEDWYWCRRISGTELELDRPYAGDTSGGNTYRRRTNLNVTGRGSIPFHGGIVSFALTLSAYALDGHNDEVAAGYRALRTKLHDWQEAVAYHPPSKGLRYAVQHSNCQVPAISPAYECWYGTNNYQRSYLTELWWGLAAEVKDGGIGRTGMLNTWYTNAFSKTGFLAPYAGDGNYAEMFSEEGYLSFGLLSKNYGQSCGVGNCGMWPAVRAGGPAPAAPREVRVAVGYPFAYGASAVRVTALQADGSVASATCETSPCSITGDFRAGGVLATVTYLSGDQVLVSSSAPMTIQ